MAGVRGLGECDLAEPVELKEGSTHPTGPGIGIAWDEKAVARYAL